MGNLGIASLTVDDFAKVHPAMTSLTREEQAKYADILCRSSVANTAFLQRQCDYMDPALPEYESWNSTSIGNLAYMLLYAKNLTDEQRDKMENLYQGYVEWEKTTKKRGGLLSRWRGLINHRY